jgi:CBS domain-containing protein
MVKNAGMSPTARQIMCSEVHTVHPDLTLPELEREFLAHQASGFPVVDQGKLVGVVSRSDIVRQLCVERTLAQTVSDYYRAEAGIGADPAESLNEVATRVGRRLEQLHVRDVMVRALISAAPDQPVADVARLLLEHHIHRVPVVEEGQLVGLISALDLVRLIAEGSPP